MTRRRSQDGVGLACDGYVHRCLSGPTRYWWHTAISFVCVFVPDRMRKRRRRQQQEVHVEIDNRIPVVCGYDYMLQHTCTNKNMISMYDIEDSSARPDSTWTEALQANPGYSRRHMIISMDSTRTKIGGRSQPANSSFVNEVKVY